MSVVESSKCLHSLNVGHFRETANKLMKQETCILGLEKQFNFQDVQFQIQFILLYIQKSCLYLTTCLQTILQNVAAADLVWKEEDVGKRPKLKLAAIMT